jgi:integrase
MLTLNRAADDFLGDCRRRGWSERTITTYRRTYDELADRLPDDYDVAKVTTDDLRRYLGKKSHLAPGTVAGIEAHLASLFKWLLMERKIAKDPMAMLPRTRRQRPADLDVVTVSTDDVRRMLFAAEGWTERICIGVLVYTGCRRRAASDLRLADYDRARRRIRFCEKGGKTIWKPIPDELDQLLEAALAAGVYETDDYLIPSQGPRMQWRRGDRDDRIVWRIVKKVAARAGVEAHTHALRAAFACFYLETHERDTIALKELMGHSTIATTEIYLRKLDKQREMERVRDLSWGVAITGESDILESTQSAVKLLSDNRLVGAGGFEPPLQGNPHG